MHFLPNLLHFLSGLQHFPSCDSQGNDFDIRSFEARESY